MTDSKERARAIGSSAGSNATEVFAAGDTLLLPHYGSYSLSSQWALSENTPTAGNYVGGTSNAASFDVSQHEQQSSALAAVAGGVMLDYVRATLPADGVVWAELQSWLGAMVERPFGWRGWYDKSAIVLDGGIVAWCSRADVAARQGVLVDLPGRACAVMGERLIPFLRWCCERGRVRRVDFALDDRRGLLTYERLWAAVAEGAIVARAHERTRIEGNAADGTGAGWTLYVGSRSSQAVVRFYDKAAEQHVAGPWVRCELEAKADFGDALARAVLERGAGEVIGQLNRRLRFVQPMSGDSRRRRWPVAPWWAEFVGSLEPSAPLTCGEAQEATIARMRECVRRQSGPMLAAVILADGGDLSWLSEVLEDGERRLKPKHLAALALARGDVGEPVLEVAADGR